MTFKSLINVNTTNNIKRQLMVPGTRNIYLHKGPRITGLKRDTQEVLTSSQGHKYENVEENIKYIEDFLQDKYKINKDLALQVITHKSFANGLKPYNEKLSAMGSKLLNLQLGKKVIESNHITNDLAINQKNLDPLGQPMAKELTGRLALGIFAKVNKLNSIMFWNSYNQGLNFESSGELKVSAQMMYALIGAINFTYGKGMAETFIDEKIFPAVEGITKQIIESEDKEVIN